MKNIITIAGVELDQENFPELYRWSKNHPDTLRETLLAWGKFHKMEADLTSVAITLESDLEHEKNVVMDECLNYKKIL